MSLKLKKNPKPKHHYDCDFWYDLTMGGYIKPEDYLTVADAKRVREAIALVQEFEGIAIESEDQDEA